MINRTPSSVLKGNYPYQVVHDVLSYYSLFKTFSCICFAINLNVCDKFSSKATKCVFFRYVESNKAYKVYDLEFGVIFCSRDVKFYENLFLFKFSNSHSDTISRDAQQFVKTFPFYDDPEPSVYDERQVVNDSNDLAAPFEVATDLHSQGVPI